jgi:dienelactone hydrolase
MALAPPRLLRVAQLLLLAAGLLPALVIGADGLYPARSPELAVEVDRSVELAAADARPLPLKIFYPDTGGPFPLIVLSHGTFSSIDRYDLIAQYWAAQGYVVILPQHKDANYGVTPSSYEVMQDVAMSRVADMSQVLDQLAAIQKQVPALAEIIDHDHYVAAGHSMGTQVAMLVTGLQFKTSYNDELITADEKRFGVLVLVSDPGKMRLMPADVWLASSVPTFMATGTDDFGLMGQRGKATEDQSEVLPNPAKAPRYQLLLEGGDHYFGGLVQKEVQGEPDYEGLAIFNATSTAFLDAQTKASPAAQRYLDQVDLAQVTNQRAQLERSE